ncbi:MAG: hypothetical protein EHM33_05810 [Chloroflexi bacterium]|nr:MAG: hypothetical protein EHM33_05810 [Chloroflexota bacterium]
MKLLRFFIPRIEYILLIAIFWGIVASGPRILNFDGDLPRHILTGNLILQTQRVPTTDIFSFRTTGHPSFPHEWLSQVLFAVAYNWLGLDGIVLLTALVIMFTWGIIYRQAIHRSKSFFPALVCIALGVGASQIHVLPRPHIFTYLLMAIWITLLEGSSENKTRPWWALPIVMLVWVNLHGMFVLGMIILGIYLIGDYLDHPSTTWFTSQKAKSLLLAGGLSLIATFFSPSGPKIWEAIASLGSNAYITSKIPEYQSANFHLPETWPFIIILLLIIVGIARSTARTPWTPILLVIAFTGIALYTSRMIPLFAMIATPILAKALAEWTRNEYFQSRLLAIEENISRINSTANGLVWIFAIVLIATVFLRSGRTIDPTGKGNIFDPRFFPVEATSWLKTHPQDGHMFNEFDWGGYLLLRLWPGQQIFMDGHTHIYGEALTREYEQVITLNPGWGEILEKYDVQWTIVRVNTSLAETLSTSSDWATAYEDETAVIFVRR